MWTHRCYNLSIIGGKERRTSVACGPLAQFQVPWETLYRRNRVEWDRAGYQTLSSGLCTLLPVMHTCIHMCSYTHTHTVVWGCSRGDTSKCLFTPESEPSPTHQSNDSTITQLGEPMLPWGYLGDDGEGLPTGARVTQRQLCHLKVYPNLDDRSWKLSLWSAAGPVVSLTGQSVSPRQLDWSRQASPQQLFTTSITQERGHVNRNSLRPVRSFTFWVSWAFFFPWGNISFPGKLLPNVHTHTHTKRRKI